MHQSIEAVDSIAHMLYMLHKKTEEMKAYRNEWNRNIGTVNVSMKKFS